MKKKILVLALIAAVLTAGLVLAGCHENCSRNGTCSYERISEYYAERTDCDDYCINDRVNENSMRYVCNCAD